MKPHFLDLKCSADISLILHSPRWKVSFTEEHSRCEMASSAALHFPAHRGAGGRAQSSLLPGGEADGIPTLARGSCSRKGFWRRQLNRPLGHGQRQFTSAKANQGSVCQAASCAPAPFKDTFPCPPPHSSLGRFFNTHHAVKVEILKTAFFVCLVLFFPFLLLCEAFNGH